MMDCRRLAGWQAGPGIAACLALRPGGPPPGNWFTGTRTVRLDEDEWVALANDNDLGALLTRPATNRRAWPASGPPGPPGMVWVHA
jgi:hypothetical protein